MHVLIPALHRPSKPTGVCRHAVNLAQCLAEADCVSRVTLLIGTWQRDYFERSFNLDSAKLKLISVDIKNSARSRNQWFLLGLPNLAHQLKPDMIHMSFPFPFIRQWFRVPVVSTIHDLYPYECPENFGYPQVWFNQAFLRQCISNSDGLICVSQATLKTLTDYFPQVKRNQKAVAIYNIVDFTGIQPKAPRQLGENFSDAFIMTVAQHRKNKNLDLLIQAYGNLCNEEKLQPNTRLLIVGSSGPETDNLSRLVQTIGRENQVMFLSGLEDGELRWLYEHSALFVIASSTEGFCLPLAEALTLACPTVCSDISIFREVGGSSQCQFFQLGSQACHNLIEAITTKLSSLTGKAKLVDDRFSKKEISRQLINFYTQF